jgi:hypothetical protein
MTKDEKEKLSREVTSMLVSGRTPERDRTAENLKRLVSAFEIAVLAASAILISVLLIYSRPAATVVTILPQVTERRAVPGSVRPAFIPPPGLKSAIEETIPVPIQTRGPEAVPAAEVSPPTPGTKSERGGLEG